MTLLEDLWEKRKISKKQLRKLLLDSSGRILKSRKGIRRSRLSSSEPLDSVPMVEESSISSRAV